MTLPTLASVSDLGTWLQASFEESDAGAQLALQLASGLVRDAAGQTWVDDDESLEDVPDGVRAVTLLAASRGYKNPTGATNVRTGPFTATWDHGSIILTPAELAALADHRPTDFGGLTVLSVTRDDLETPAVAEDLGLSAYPDLTGDAAP